MALLDKEAIENRLKHLSGWEFKDNSLRKLFRFKEFMEAIRFVNRIAEAAEAMDHHPDITINYTRVTCSCSTHSEHGVTDKDFKLAEEIERIYSSLAK